MTEISDLQRRACDIAARYDGLNLAQRGRTWTAQETMLGFAGDVGDLAKLVMSTEGTRSDLGSPDEIRAALEHELSDCLWSTLVLAAHYDVDLAAVFTRTMDELDERIDTAFDQTHAGDPG